MSAFFRALAEHPVLTGVALVATPYFLVFIALQKKAFSRGATKCLTRFYFKPTTPLLILHQKYIKRVRDFTCVDDGIYLGCFPSSTLGDVRRMHDDLQIGGVINLMDEWEGPVAAYEKYGIQQLRLPTIDHMEPSVKDMERAVAFIREIREHADHSGVLIHCKGGHGRSAVSGCVMLSRDRVATNCDRGSLCLLCFVWVQAIAVCWLLAEKNMTPQQAAQHLLSRRKVRKKLASQPNINAFWDNLHQRSDL